MRGLPGFHDLREEILERIWNLSESGGATLGALRELAEEEQLRSRIEGLAGEGLLRLEGERLVLTPAGERFARHVVRAHRLAARLLTDLLELAPEEVEGLACRLEHAISDRLADSLCTLLGHPPTAPGGSPIPPGACCASLRREVAPMVRSLVGLDLGMRGRVTFIHARGPGRLDQLAALGLVPGTEVRLRQHHPSVVIEVGETTLALDTAVARDVFVKPLE